MAFDITTLQNGNTICGKAEGDGELTKEIAGRVGGSFVYWLSQNAQKNPTMLKICVGCEIYSRPGGSNYLIWYRGQ